MFAYCDYIAKVISEAMKKDSTRNAFTYIDTVGKTHWDLDEKGRFLSTKKTISVIDKSGKAYRVTVEEIK